MYHVFDRYFYLRCVAISKEHLQPYILVVLPSLFQDATCSDLGYCVSTGLSDFHNMVVSVLKSEVPKGKPKKIFYRNYKNFDNSNFKAELRSEIELNQISDHNNFENVFLRVLEKHAPLKKKLVRANETPYITKTLRKTIVRRSQLENREPERIKPYSKNKKTFAVGSTKKKEQSIMQI